MREAIILKFYNHTRCFNQNRQKYVFFLFFFKIFGVQNHKCLMSIIKMDEQNNKYLRFCRRRRIVWTNIVNDARAHGLCVCARAHILSTESMKFSNQIVRFESEPNGSWKSSFWQKKSRRRTRVSRQQRRKSFECEKWLGSRIHFDFLWFGLSSTSM